MRIKRITPKSLAKILGLLQVICGAIVGLLMGFIGIVAVFTGDPSGWRGLIVMIFVPLVYGIIGLIMGYMLALIYNFIAKKVGGIEIEIETE